MMKQTVAIGGMTCAACARRIERAVGKMAGVAETVVNFAPEKLSVEYDEKVLALRDIEKKVMDTGYSVIKKSTVDEDKIRKEREIRTLKRKFLVSAVFGAPLLYLAMVSMIWWLWWLPFPKILKPMQYPVNYALVQILLVIPILIAGRNFYYVGFRALFMGSPNMD